MDWNRVLWAALGGGVGGGLGGAIAMQVTSKAMKRAFVVLPMVFLARVAPELMVQHPLLPASKVERALRRAEPALQESPALARLLQGKSPAEASALTQEQSHAGLKRLSPEDLLLWNRLRLAIAERNPALCARFWSGGGPPPNALLDTLNQMDQAEVDGFIGVSLRATVAEVENRPFEAPRPAAFRTAMPKIKEGLAAAEVHRLDRVLGQGVSAPADDACWAVKVFMRDSSRLTATERDGFLRFIASL